MKHGHRRVNCYCVSRRSCRNIPSSPLSTGMTSWPEKSDPLSSQKWYEWIRNELDALFFLTEETWLTPLSSSGWSLGCQLHWPSVYTTTCTCLCERHVPGGRGQRGLPRILLHEPCGVPGSRAGFITTPNPPGARLFSCFFFTSLIFKWVSIFKNLSKKIFMLTVQHTVCFIGCFVLCFVFLAIDVNSICGRDDGMGWSLFHPRCFNALYEALNSLE